jgi:hypothetical protein
MSTPRIISQQLHDLEARIEYRDGRLALRAGRHPVLELLVEQARAVKAELLALLSAQNAPNTPSALRTTLDEHLRGETPKNTPESRRNLSSTEGAHPDEHLREDSPEDEHLREHLQQNPEGAQITPRRCSSHEHLRAGQHSCGLKPLRRRRCSPNLVVRAFAIFRPRGNLKLRVGFRELRGALRTRGEWHEGIALLHPDHPPLDVPAKRWRLFIDDARRLLGDGTIA